MSSRKSLICRFSICQEKYDRPISPSAGSPKAEDAWCIEKSSMNRSRKCTFSKLAGCGCQSRGGSVFDRIPADSRMPEVCSVQSPPSCSALESNVGICPQWVFGSSFDEMIKLSSGSQQVHYFYKSSIQKNMLQLGVSPVKFSDLVNKFPRSESISTEKIDGPVTRVVSSKLSFLRRPLRQNVNGSSETMAKKVDQSSNVENSSISKRKDRLTDCLLIMKSSCDPQREFKDSIVEMIVESDLQDGKDMEELLACYLFLNSEDYHDVIIQVFKQIWAEHIQATLLVLDRGLFPHTQEFGPQIYMLRSPSQSIFLTLFSSALVLLVITSFLPEFTCLYPVKARD